MKRKLISFTLIGILFASCTIQKRHYLKGFYFEKAACKAQGQSKSSLPKELREVMNSRTDNTKLTLEASNTPRYVCSVNKNPSKYSNTSFIAVRKFNEDCDLIILKTGEEIKGKVIEITLTEIKYKKCDNLSGPTISVSKSEVFMIKYPNGSKDIITTPKNTAESTTTNSSETKTSGFAIAGFILSLVAGSIFWYFSVIGGIIAALLAIIFSSMALVQIRKNSSKFKGRGLAVAGLIIGVLATLGCILILGAVL